MLEARDDEKLARHIAELIVALRNSRALSLRGAAKLLGMHHTRLMSLEKGIDRGTGKATLPSPEQIAAMARVYRYPKERLLLEAGYFPWRLNADQADQVTTLMRQTFADTRPGAPFIAAEALKAPWPEE